ncbi:MAG: STAS domain-containing protein [Bacteroidaceae bacterium]|nr:STAS domain-containing protein [Candidatus Equimonas faecalis]MCQ2205634.1 STAS domain-containing protein [Bacteroidaceae bacterium]
MTLKITKGHDAIVAHMSGSLDTLAAEQIEPQVEELEALTAQPITIDCTDLAYIASSGLRLFIRLRKAAFTHGQKITLKGVNANVMEVLRITNFDKMFVIE